MTGTLWCIVGATSGFGLEITTQALARGDQVVATSRRATTAESLKRTMLESPSARKDLLLLDLDATSSDQVLKDALTTATDHFGGKQITYFINCVGYILEGAAEEVSAEEAVRSITTNVLAIMNLCRVEAEYLRTRAQAPYSSTATPTTITPAIANFGSVGSWQGGAAYSHYAAAKWAVSGFTESLHEELKPFGIHVLVIEPGYFRTGFLNEGGGNRLVAAKQLSREYQDTPVAEVKKALAMYNNKQPGDVVKGCKVIIDVLTGTGVAEGKGEGGRGPRLLLGKDCVRDVREKMTRTEKYIQEWEDVITSTDHDDVWKG